MKGAGAGTVKGGWEAASVLRAAPTGSSCSSGRHRVGGQEALLRLLKGREGDADALAMC